MKKQLKGEIKYGVTLDEEQKIAKAGAFDKDVTFLLGKFGSGKSLLATAIAIDMLFKKQVSKIYITRPIDFSATGFIPGDLSAKMRYHIYPLVQNFVALCGKEKVDKLLAEDAIEIIPIDYIKGYTICNAVLIIDEFEDISYKEFEKILTRLGKDSKLIFTGSEEQTEAKDSCIKKIKLLVNCPLVNYHVLKAQHRNEAIQGILDYIEESFSPKKVDKNTPETVSGQKDAEKHLEDKVPISACLLYGE